AAHPRDRAHARSGSRGRDEVHHVQAERIGLGVEEIRLLGRQIDDEHAVHAGFDGGTTEGLETEREDRVVVDHEHERRGEIVPQLAHHLEHAREPHPGGERALGGPLYPRPVGERVREGHPKLDDVGALPRGLEHERGGGGERGIAGGEVRDEGALATRTQGRERGVEAAHGWPFPLPSSAWPTVWTSLSPRPERPTTTISDFFIRRAALMAYATACADSSAGMSPSRRVRVWKASSASASVMDSYWKRPASLY